MGFRLIQPTLKCWDLCISGTAEAANFKFGVMQNYGTKEAWPRSCNPLLNFETPSISLEGLKLQYSNLVRRLTVESNIKFQNHSLHGSAELL